MQPRYASVAKELSDAIASGLYPVGSILPPEITLAETMGVSRSTMRAAMRELQASGLISRNKSAGTRVEAARPPEAGRDFYQAIGSLEEVQQFGDATIRQTVEVTEIVADDALALQLGVRPGSRWLRISSIRLWRDMPGNLPACWTDAYIAADFATGVQNRLAGSKKLFSELIEETSGRRIQEIRQQIMAKPVPDVLAEPLKTEANAAALVVRRQYVVSQGTLAEVSWSVHPGDRFIHNTKLSRTK